MPDILRRTALTQFKSLEAIRLDVMWPEDVDPRTGSLCPRGEGTQALAPQSR